MLITPTVDWIRSAIGTIRVIYGEELGHAPDDYAIAFWLLHALGGLTGDQIRSEVHGSPEADAYRRRPTHVDPSTIPLRQLARIRGSMWATPRLSLPYGPRPGQPTNICAMDYFEHYPPADQARALAAYCGEGYTHAVTGPLVDPGGYHGTYPTVPERPTQASWDAYLDMLERWWDAKLAPIFFCHPDGWSFDDTRRVFEPLLLQPRAQRLIRIIVPGGWEPALYDWSSVTWAKYFAWARQVLPNALVGWHNAVKPDGSAPDAPCGEDDAYVDTGHPNGEAWARCAPHLHFWLVQSGPYRRRFDPRQDAEWAAMFKADGDGERYRSIKWHLAHGIDGWPRGSAWGSDAPLLLIAAEQTSYHAFWHDLPADDCKTWGDAAIAAGADGYLDGGTVSVP